MSVTMISVLLLAEMPRLHRLHEENILFFTNFQTAELPELTTIQLYIGNALECEFHHNSDDNKKIYEVNCDVTDCNYIYTQGTAGTERVMFTFIDGSGEELGELLFKKERSFSSAAVIIIACLVVVIFGAVLVFVLFNKFSRKPRIRGNGVEMEPTKTEILIVERDEDQIVPASSIRQSIQLEPTESSIATVSRAKGLIADFPAGGRCIRQSLDVRRYKEQDEPSGSSRNYVSEPFMQPYSSDKSLFANPELLLVNKRHANECVQPTIAEMTYEGYADANSALEDNINVLKTQNSGRVRHIEDLEAIPEVVPEESQGTGK